jgi:hypothetical protein
MLEKIRDQIRAATPAPADFNLAPDGSRTVFALDQVTGIAWKQQVRVDPPSFSTDSVTPGLLRIIPGAVGQLAYGKYLSPDYEVHPGEYIPQVGTLTGTPVVQAVNEIYFNLVLPSGAKPSGGWPVAIFGHGNTDAKDSDYSLVNVAAVMASHGIATITINAVGHGFGPLGSLTVNRRASDGGPVTFASGGRGIDQNEDHNIDANEGLFTAPPQVFLINTDGVRQTVADLMQLVRVIEVGVDVDGDGVPDLDPSRIYYFGHSLGGQYGTVLVAVDPSLRAGVLNDAGGPPAFARRLSIANRGALGTSLQGRVPRLINSPGIIALDGVGVSSPFFNDNMPLRNGTPLVVLLQGGVSQTIQSPVTNTVAGAMAIQEYLDCALWVQQSGSPAAYAPHLRHNPLAGVPAKPVIFQIAKGDQTVPNPGTTAILRAGDLADRETYYRHDLAFADNRNLPKDPHNFIHGIDDPGFKAIALGAQEQIASFFASDGMDVIQPEPAKYFEVPIQGPLPEELNYIP